MNDEIVLCGASSYNKKYYFNEQFSSLPQGIQDELHIMCVLFTADVGGVLQVVFDEDGSLHMERAGLVCYNHGVYQKTADVLGFFGHSVARSEVLEKRMRSYRG